MPHVSQLKPGRFSHATWRFESRPTSEAVGVLAHPDTDIESMVTHILDVENYPDNVRYVEAIDLIERRSDSDVTYVQHMNLPLIGRIQVQIHLSDFGERDGFRIVAWDQDDEATEALDKKHGARTHYNLGAWLLRTDAVGYALSTAPRKSDVGTLKYLAMTKGADATATEVLKINIEGMIAWAHRD